MITSQQIKTICPYAREYTINAYIPSLNLMMQRYGINSVLRISHFIAQLSHESGQFNNKEENLNYTADQLVKQWPKIYTKELAEKYAGKPQAIANFTYKNYGGNGSEASGDGWRYRGRGGIMLSLKDNYRIASRDIFGDDTLVANPDKVLEPAYWVEVSCWFWKKNNLNRFADKDDIVSLTKTINGGLLGLDDRRRFYDTARSVINYNNLIVIPNA